MRSLLDPRRWLFPAVVLGLGLMSGLWLYVSYRGFFWLEGYESRISLGDALGSGVMDWVLWAPLWPLALLVARRWPVARGRARALLAYALAAPLFSLAQLVLFALASVALRSILYDQDPALSQAAIIGDALQAAFQAKFKGGVLLAGLCLAGITAFDAWRAAREEERKTAELGRRLAEARLAALRSTLEPHFLFNALNTIQSLVRTEPATAERMIARLGDLLRASLATTGRPEVSLAEELDLLENYLAIERERFGSRLQVEIDAPSETLAARVPTLILQPLVENAVHHGLSRRTGEARIALAARVDANRLYLALQDDGPGFTPGASSNGHRIGLASVSARLAAVHGDRASLSVATASAGGTRVEIELPFVAVGAS